MIISALLSYLAGMLTVLAPCVLPLLPIILGGSFRPDQSKWRPYIIIGSLIASLTLFTVLLRVSTLLIGIDPRVWSIASGVLVILLGLFMLFPGMWAKVIHVLHIEQRSQRLLGNASQQSNGTISAVLTGLALGPVFSSCSPTFAWVIATVLPSDTPRAVLFLSMYILGLGTSLLAIALLGKKLLVKITWASDPKGWFQRGIAVLFIVVGLFVATGWDKRVQTYLVERDFLQIKVIENTLVPSDQ